MRYCLVIFCFVTVYCIGQTNKPVVYLIHGQGSDYRLFDSLKLDTNYSIRKINYTTPPKHATMNSFARLLAQQIDTTQPFVLVGVSLGGMLCAEMSSFLKPKRIILISSAQNRKELPFRYRFQRVIPLYEIFPGRLLLGGAKLMQPIVEPDRKHNKTTFKSMLRRKNGVYMKRTVRLIMRWERTSFDTTFIRIHGTNDHTLPLRKINTEVEKVEKGSHMMTLTRAADVSRIINRHLAELSPILKS